MRYPGIKEVFELHRRMIGQSGGSAGIRDLGMLESALAQPRMTFGGEDLYPTIIEKAVALAFSLVNNHPFVDGNKRVGHAAMEVFLVMDGHEIRATVDEQERIILAVASGGVDREDFTRRLRARVIEKKDG